MVQSYMLSQNQYIKDGDIRNKTTNNSLLSVSKMPFIPKRLFLQYKKQLAKLLKVFNFDHLTVWVYELKDDYKFHHMNIGITIPKGISKKAVVRNRLKRKIRKLFMPFLKNNKRLFIWVRVK